MDVLLLVTGAGLRIVRLSCIWIGRGLVLVLWLVFGDRGRRGCGGGCGLFLLGELPW